MLSSSGAYRYRSREGPPTRGQHVSSRAQALYHRAGADRPALSFPTAPSSPLAYPVVGRVLRHDTPKLSGSTERKSRERESSVAGASRSTASSTSELNNKAARHLLRSLLFLRGQ
jgi:hypothetical protein